MPRPVTLVYQPRGKHHLKYIKRMAQRIWADAYGCRDDGAGSSWRQALKDAMTMHRLYLKTGRKTRPLKMFQDQQLLPEPDIKYSAIPPKEEGSFWHDPKTKLWVPMDLSNEDIIARRNRANPKS